MKCFNMIRRHLLTLLGLLALLSSAASQCPEGLVPCGDMCSNVCDGLVECLDRSDETYELCSKKMCNSTNHGTGNLEHLFKFQCAYGGCIRELFVCNGHPDCWDHSDEAPELCSSKQCTRRQFRCDYGACIRRTWLCNGNYNCLDKSDETEKHCKSKRCRSSQFKCAYGGCIPRGKRCDGTPDCVDNSDESEEECGAGLTIEPRVTVAPPPTNHGTGNLEHRFEFRCAYGGYIWEWFVCNGHPDCWDHSDEAPELCSSKQCTRRQFRCDYGACIRRTWLCNGNYNCLDKSDETEKHCKSKRCRSSQFKCAYGGCIPRGKKCDGTPDCVDNSDESEEECGAGHTIKPRVTVAPPPTVPASPPKPPVVITPRTPVTTATTQPKPLGQGNVNFISKLVSGTRLVFPSKVQ